jgi:hypothetical protein
MCVTPPPIQRKITESALAGLGDVLAPLTHAAGINDAAALIAPTRSTSRRESRLEHGRSELGCSIDGLPTRQISEL